MPEEGLRLVLTAPQLAAIIVRGTLEQPSFAKRGWGAAKALIGAVEVLGGGALLVTPEPTMLTKVGGGALALHGADTFQAGVRQAASGLDTDSMTHDATSALAERLGVDVATAERIGTAVDILVPVAVSGGLAAARIAAVRGGRISLAAHEAAGGHAIARHVGRTEAQLRARLAAQQSIPAASTFTTLARAEQAVGHAIRVNAQAIASWAGGAAPNASRAFSAAFPNAGQGVVRSTGQLVRMNSVRIVLRKQVANGRLYYILTAFPIP